MLVVGAESLSKITDYTDRTTCILFGDGAGAVVLSKEQGQHGILSTLLYADGSCSDLLYMPGGGSAHPASTETIAKRYHYLKMDGNKVFKTAVKALEDCVVKILEKNNLTGDQICPAHFSSGQSANYSGHCQDGLNCRRKKFL